MIAFTWNLHKNQLCLELACKHLAGLAAADSCVGVFQEVPKDLDDEFVKTHGGGRLQLVSRPRPNAKGRQLKPKVAMLISQDLEIDPNIQRHEYNPSVDKNRRMEGVGIRRRDQAWQGLHVLGVHGRSRLDAPTESERLLWAHCMQKILQQFWDKNGPLVMLGDFNANPYHLEMTTRSGVLALRKKDGLSRRRTLPESEEAVNALYNPMWQLLPDRGSRHALGTNVFNDRNDGMYWLCYDQVLVSQDLRPCLEGLTVHEQICKERLVDGKRRPCRSTVNNKSVYKYSDHLPVQARIALERRK